MSSFKADWRYMGRRDDPSTDESDNQSDEQPSEEEVPARVARDRAAWWAAYSEEITIVYGDFLRAGQAMFGSSFFQLGSVVDFGNVVFKYTQPGST